MIDQSLVIIPTYNEALNVKAMIEKLFSLYPALSVLIIDDNSPDQTALIVEELKKHYKNLHLIKREGKLGLGTAYVAGFEWALSHDYNYILQMDCDFSHNPEDIKVLLAELHQQKSSLAIGSRYCGKDIRTKDWPLYRLILSLGASYLVRLFTGVQIRDMIGGFKCFHRSALEQINLKNIISKGYIFQFEMNYKIHRKGSKIIEVPIVFSERAHGVSKMSLKIIFEAVKVLLQLRLQTLFKSI